MKRPSFDKEKIVGWLIAHGDKFVVGAIALGACGLAWGGIDAIRSHAVSEPRAPKTILDSAARTSSGIDREKAPPAGVRVDPGLLATRTAPWESPKLEKAKLPPVLNKPLFEELAKRSKPEILPMEKLEATAGVVVLAAAPQEVPRADAAVPLEPQKPAAGRRGKKDAAAGPRGEFGPSPFGPGPFGGPPPLAPPVNPGFAPAGQGQVPNGKIVPYVIVTGLIPYEKQREEYRRRFMQASYREERRDEPAWSEYLVERAEIMPDGRENWERLDLKTVAKNAKELWAGIQAETLPAEFMLPGPGGVGPGAAPGTVSFSGYCLPLPQLASDGWGPATMHSWFLEQLETSWAEKAAPAIPQSPVAIDGPSNPDRPPEFGVPGVPGEGRFDPALGPPEAGLQGGPGMPGSVDGRAIVGPPYRLFRFVDTSVQIGRRYRYRVRLSVWNPNRKLPARYLTDAGLATADRLPSPPSEVSPVVRVPDPVHVLVRSLHKGDMKRFKAGMLEAIVIGESAATGNYALRSLITEPGGIVNVDPRLNKPGETRARGEQIRTDRIIVDVRGRQQDRAEERAADKPSNPSAPSEPFELLVLRPDGQFEVASLAESQASIEANVSTLPVIESQAKPPGETAPPLGSPF